jgi:hypothetical protein
MHKYFTLNTSDIPGDYEYGDNQYEEYHGGRFYYKEQVNARYIKQEELDYMENPLIEALPPVYTIEQIAEKLHKLPLYSPEERKKSEEYRIQAISRLKNFLYVFSKHIEIEKKLSLVLRRGYSTKNITTPTFIEKVKFTSKLLNADWCKDKLENLQCISNSSDTPMAGFSLIGISGGGKSTALNNILTMYPQCIVHTDYDGHKFLFKQLVWIKIDCTYNGNIKGLCTKFFEEVDKVLGTNYERKFGNKRNSVDDMIIAMAHIAQIHALGTLVIDEIQHLASFKSGADEVLNFLVTLENEIKLPMIYIGTYKAAKKVLSLDFRQARRASGIGEIEWEFLPSSDDEWEGFIEEMWNFQWTKKESPLTQELKDLFYKKTVGITDRIIKLYVACQLQAILSNMEEITPALVEKIADEQMPLTKRMISALRDKNLEDLVKFDDIHILDIDKMVENANEKLKFKNDLKNVLKSEVYKTKLKKSEVLNELTLLIAQIGFTEKNAIEIANSVIAEHGFDKNIDFLKRQVGKKISEYNNSDTTTAKAKTKNPSTAQKVKNKGTEDKSIYEKYREENKIKTIKDDFDV